MSFKFELFGFHRDRHFNVTSFWIGSFTNYNGGDLNGTEWNLFLTGRSQGEWILELFGRWICGPKETLIS